MKTFRTLPLMVAAAVPVAGCIPKDLDASIFTPIFAVIAFTDGFQSPGKTEIEKIRETPEITVQGDIGGLDGTYDLDLYLGETFLGNVTGTAQVKGGRNVTIVSKGDDGMEAVVAALFGEMVGGEVEITKFKSKIKGSQTTGGASSKFNLNVKIKGNVLSGPMAGGDIKNGKIGGKGEITP